VKKLSKKPDVMFGRISIPATEHHQQTGIYVSLDWSIIKEHVQIDFYPPSLGDPIYEEASTKTYSFKLGN